jgi:hypothetical protein
MAGAPSGLLPLKRVSQAKLSWPFGPKTRLYQHPSFREMPKLQGKQRRLTYAKLDLGTGLTRICVLFPE